jgi:hypothetical protein
VHHNALPLPNNNIKEPDRIMKFPIAIATLLLAALLTVSVGNVTPALAQDEQVPAPGKPQATEGENQGEVIVT